MTRPATPEDLYRFLIPTDPQISADGTLVAVPGVSAGADDGMLASLLTLDRLFTADHEDGSLDLILMARQPLELALAADRLEQLQRRAALDGRFELAEDRADSPHHEQPSRRPDLAGAIVVAALAGVDENGEMVEASIENNDNALRPGMLFTVNMDRNSSIVITG